jgi:hypothetical protein
MIGMRHLVAAVLAAAGIASCGASIRAVYEGDVRFEHCMALDTRSDVKPTIRRSCWEEWVSFYTFGQTRDRIEYAHLRAKQLGAASDFDEADTGPTPIAVAPAPTSAIAPPPLTMISDGGAPDAAPFEDGDDRAVARARCTASCQQGLDACERGCKKTPPCEKACAARLARCTARCGQGSR